jgi:hypothetical protein
MILLFWILNSPGEEIEGFDRVFQERGFLKIMLAYFQNISRQ